MSSVACHLNLCVMCCAVLCCGVMSGMMMNSIKANASFIIVSMRSWDMLSWYKPCRTDTVCTPQYTYIITEGLLYECAVSTIAPTRCKHACIVQVNLLYGLLEVNALHLVVGRVAALCVCACC